MSFFPFLCHDVASVIRLSTFHIFKFFSRMAAGIYSNLGTNVPFEVLTKCCYLLSGSNFNPRNTTTLTIEGRLVSKLLSDTLLFS